MEERLRRRDREKLLKKLREREGGERERERKKERGSGGKKAFLPSDS